MVGKYPSRDEIAYQIFGRKFSQLDSAAKEYVGKTQIVMLSEGRQGKDYEGVVRRAVRDECVRIVKQLKEIQVNPGDEIQLPRGVLTDAAKVINYQWKASGRGRVLDATLMSKIRRDIAKEFGVTEPGLVEGITDYITNPKGRYHGINPKTLRGKLGSFLTKEKLDSISNKEIAAARDIVIAHLFDKWSGGNLSSFVKPKLVKIAESESEKLKRGLSVSTEINKSDAERAISGAAAIAKLYSNPHLLKAPWVIKAMQNMGYSPEILKSNEVKEAVYNVITESANQVIGRGRLDINTGTGLRWKKRTSRQPVTIKNVRKIGRTSSKLSSSNAQVLGDIEDVMGSEFLSAIDGYDSFGYDFDPGNMAMSVDEISDIAQEQLEQQFKRNLSKQPQIFKNQLVSHDIASIFGIGKTSTAITSGKATPIDTISTLMGADLGIHVKSSPSPVDVHGLSQSSDTDREVWSSLFDRYAMAITAKEYKSALHTAYLNELYERETATLNNFDLYENVFGSYGKILAESYVPIDAKGMHPAMATTFHGLVKALRSMDSLGLTDQADKVAKTLIQDYGFTPRREESIIEESSYLPKSRKSFDPVRDTSGLIDDLYSEGPLGSAITTFHNLFPGMELPDELSEKIDSVRTAVATGKLRLPGMKRVGVVGSKSWDNERFMRKWFNKNWDYNDMMISSTEIGVGDSELTPTKSRFGAAYQARNWAHWNNIPEYAFNVRKERLKTSGAVGYKKDMTTSDVINASDEVVAFFDRAYLSESTLKQIGKIRDALFNLVERKKTNPDLSLPKLRIVLNPYDSKIDYTISPKQQHMPIERVIESLLGFYKNKQIEIHEPGTEYALFKFLAKGGSLKSNETALVGEAGPELLIPTGAGGFNVVPNHKLRKLAEGTLNLSSYARNVTGEPQPDEHDYIDPETGEIWPSVTKIKNMGKSYTGGSYYGDVGSVAHYYAAQALGPKHGLDVSHIKYPNVSASSDLKGVNHTVEEIDSEGKRIAEQFSVLADTMGFIPTLIEQRFVNTKDKYSGTLDIGGFIRDELGNLVPAIADFKTSSKVDKDFAEQIAAYADFFSDAVKGFVIHVKRDMSDFGIHEMDLVKGFDGFQKKLEAYNKQMGPRPIFGQTSETSTAVEKRLRDMENTPVWIKHDSRGGEPYIRRGITTTVAAEEKALGKIFPLFKVGGIKNKEWDKHPDRLEVFGKRLDELYNSAANAPGTVNPTIKKILESLETAGVGHADISNLVESAMGSVKDNPALIKVFRGFYDSLKPIAFNQGLLSGSPEQRALWEDARTLLNVFEEAAKSFQSMPDLTAPAPHSRSVVPTAVPGEESSPLIPPIGSTARTRVSKKAGIAVNPYGISMQKGKPTVNLCDPTLKALNVMISSAARIISNAIKVMNTGGSTRGSSKSSGYSRSFTPFGNLPTAAGIRGILERAPIIGQPLVMKRRWNEVQDQIADFDPNTQSYEDYIKLQKLEEINRGKYYRSIRGATTSFLIAQHVMRVFGQTSQVYAKSSEAVGKGLGYIFDMALVPMIPILNPLVKGLISIGNVVKTLGSGPVLFLAGYMMVKFVKSIHDFVTEIGSLPETVRQIRDALASDRSTISETFTGTDTSGAYSGFPLPPPTPTKQYENPIGPAAPGMRQRLKRMFGFSTGIDNVPGTGNRDSVLAMLTPGEMVIPKDIARNIRGYAAGGIVGDTLGGMTSAYTSLVTSDIGSGIIAGMSMISKTFGAMLAPLSPMFAGLGAGYAGIEGIKKAIYRGMNIVTAINQGGFSALRTVATAQLMTLASGLGALLPLVGIGAGIYAIINGYGASINGITAGIRTAIDTGKAILDKIVSGVKDFYEWVKERFKLPDLPEIKRPYINTPGTKELPISDIQKKLIEPVKRELPPKDAGELKLLTEGSKEESDIKTEKPPNRWAEWLKNIKLPELKIPETIRGIPTEGILGMGGVGAILGVMKSNDPMEWIKSAGLGVAAQGLFNAVGAATKYVGVQVGGRLGGLVGAGPAGAIAGSTVANAGMTGLGVALTPGVAQQVADAITEGNGPLSPATYSPLIKGNSQINKSAKVLTQMIIGAFLEGMVISPDMMPGMGNEELLKTLGHEELIPDIATKVPQFANGGIVGETGLAYVHSGETILSNDSNSTIITLLSEIKSMLKQPTINQNTFQFSTDDEYKLMQKIDNALAARSNAAGAQRSI